MRDLVELIESKSKPSDINIVDISYSFSSLSPVFSASSLRNHYEKLAKGYAKRFNAKEGDSTFNYAGAWLHNVLFMQFRSPRPKNIPNGPVGNLIRSKHGSWDEFKEKFKEEALKVQGSGWVYLARDGSIKRIQNHQVKNDILVLVDMWEHAWQPDYGSDKKKYLSEIWKIIDWNVINTRWGQGYK